MVQRNMIPMLAVRLLCGATWAIWCDATWAIWCGATLVRCNMVMMVRCNITMRGRGANRGERVNT